MFSRHFISMLLALIGMAIVGLVGLFFQDQYRGTNTVVESQAPQVNQAQSQQSNLAPKQPAPSNCRRIGHTTVC